MINLKIALLSRQQFSRYSQAYTKNYVSDKLVDSTALFEALKTNIIVDDAFEFDHSTRRFI